MGKKRLSKSARLAVGLGAFIFEAIRRSHENVAYAECTTNTFSATFCIEPDQEPICITDKFSRTYDYNISFYVNDAYPQISSSITETTSTGLIISPTSQSYGPPYILQSPRIFTPQLSHPDVPVGPPVVAQVSITGLWGYFLDPLDVSRQETFTINRSIYIVHANSAPVITSNTHTIISPTSVQINLSVTDADADDLNLLLELSTNPDILGTVEEVFDSIPNTGVNQTYSHTFTGLDPDTTYYWRIYLEEQNPTDLCESVVGFDVQDPNSTTSEIESFTINQTTETIVQAILFQDLNGDSIKQSEEPEIPFVTITLTTSEGSQNVVTSDSPNGFFTAEVIDGQLQLLVDESDPDVPTDHTYSGPTLFTIIDGQVNDLGYLPMVGPSATEQSPTPTATPTSTPAPTSNNTNNTSTTQSTSTPIAQVLGLSTENGLLTNAGSSLLLTLLISLSIMFVALMIVMKPKFVLLFENYTKQVKKASKAKKKNRK